MSIVGNICAKITLMRSKSEAETTLYRINQDGRVVNEIFMNNAP